MSVKFSDTCFVGDAVADRCNLPRRRWQLRTTGRYTRRSESVRALRSSNGDAAHIRVTRLYPKGHVTNALGRKTLTSGSKKLSIQSVVACVKPRLHMQALGVMVKNLGFVLWL
jgi:hypothetical protein